MKKLLVAATLLISLGSASAQEVQKKHNATNYGKSNIETKTFSSSSYHDATDFSQQRMEFNESQNLDLNNPLSSIHVNNENTDYRWKNLILYGGNNRNSMVGLMDKRDAEVGLLYHQSGLSLNVGLTANVYNFNTMTVLQNSPIRNQFGIKGSLHYDFNNNVSVTFYGQYVNNPFYHSMAAFPYVATSSFGGYFTLQNENIGIDLGVNNYYDAFSHSWRTDPIVRPKYKIGKVKIDMDLGPLMKEGILRLAGKKRYAGPMIMP